MCTGAAIVGAGPLGGGESSSPHRESTRASENASRPTPIWGANLIHSSLNPVSLQIRAPRCKRSAIGARAPARPGTFSTRATRETRPVDPGRYVDDPLAIVVGAES